MGETLQIVVGGTERDDDPGSGDEVVELDEKAASRVVTPTSVDLLRTIASERPESIRATADAVDRDVKNVHENLMELSRLGLVDFEWEGRARRPVVPYDAVSVTVPVGGDSESGE